MIKSIYVNNYRCLQNFTMEFEDDITLVVGENDAGKTSLVDALKVILQGINVEKDDFCYGTNKIDIQLNIDDNVYLAEYFLAEENITNKLYILISHEKLLSIKEFIKSDDFNTYKEDEQLKKLKDLANLVGVTYRSNSSIKSLTQNINDKIDNLLSKENPAKCESKMFNLKMYFLDGKHFKDISMFLNELFFKEKKKNIWSEKVTDDLTVEEFIKKTLEEYSVSIEEDINNNGLKEKLHDFLPELTEISINSNFEPRDLSIYVSVKLLENFKEIPIDKKGDGTKRRITMALLDYNTEKEDKSNAIYLLDEPDTHLHVKAQLELMNIVRKVIKEKNQMILTTHSPFLINSCKPNQIRLIRNIDNVSKIKYLKKDDDIDSLLRNLGVENIYLFFARKILIVEGQTEEKFIPIIYERIYGKNLHSDLIKIINVQGIKNVPGFARAILEMNSKENIYALIDNDADDATKELINKLEMKSEHKIEIGNKEFEDSFKESVIDSCWRKYVESREKKVGELWNEDNISKIKNECIAEGKKFSKELGCLNSGCQKKFSKIELGIALGEYCNIGDLDPKLMGLLTEINN